MTALMIIIAAAVLNRVRGGGFYGDRLPGRALLWAAPAMGLLALRVAPWPVALGLAAGYAFWAVFSWGHVLAALGGFKPDRSPSTVEALCQMLPGALLPAFARMMFVLPGIWLVAWLKGDPALVLLAPAFAAMATLAYALIFRSMHALDWARAEIVVGALWGGLLVIITAA